MPVGRRLEQTNRGRTSPNPWRQEILLCAIATTVLGTGCFQGSLATSTGARVHGPWSVAKEQYACPDEEVRFDFILSKPFGKQPIDPTGIADYCVLDIGSDRLASRPDVDGHFRFYHKLKGFAPGIRVTVTATAYRTTGRPDALALGDPRYGRGHPAHEPDRAIAKDSIQLVIYQPKFVVEIEEPDNPLDFTTARLEIRRADGSIVEVYESQPQRRGFKVTRPNDGVYHITYIAGSEEINPIGTTDAELIVYDRAGERRTVAVTIETP
jgi:hypothetical protein